MKDPNQHSESPRSNNLMRPASLPAALAAALLVLILASPVPARADIEQMVLRVDGLACPFCSYGLEKKLSRIEGVQEIDIEMDSGTVLLSLTPGAVIYPDELNKAVSDAGFTLAGLELIATGRLTTRDGQPCLEFGGNNAVVLMLKGEETLQRLLTLGEGAEVRVSGRASSSGQQQEFFSLEVSDYEDLS